MENKVLSHPDFGDVRTTYDDNGTVLFCASDVAKILGYSNPNKAINDHCRAITKRYSPISGKIMEINYIYEPDVYRLVAKSKLPMAIQFEKWIFETVLPTIRLQGFYAKKEMIQNPDFLIELGELGKRIKEEEAQRVQLQEEVQVLTVQAEENLPKLNYLDTILNSHCALTTTQIAADYGISARRLNQILNEERVQRKVSNQWILYVAYMNQELTESNTIVLPDGKRTVVQTKWTQRGRLFIHDILTKRGFQPR